MDIKEMIIQLFLQHRGQYISEQDIAEHLHIGKAAVRNIMHNLQVKGFCILSTPEKGYMIEMKHDVISRQGILCYLNKNYLSDDVYVYPCVDSTNNVLKEKAIQGASNYAMVIANEQTKGKGRFDRSFYSPKDAGIYMSLLIRDRKQLQEATFITIIAAVGTARVIKRHAACQPQIKWVNDIYLDDKKVCGILTESIIDIEHSMSEAMIIGIGINIANDQTIFPDSLQEKATVLSSLDCDRNQMIAEIANEVYQLYEYGHWSMIMTEYKAQSYVLHKIITFSRHKTICKGYVIDINDQGGLIIDMQGEILTLCSGEVSILHTGK